MPHPPLGLWLEPSSVPPSGKKGDVLKVLIIAPMSDKAKRTGVSGHTFSLMNWLGRQPGIDVSLACFGLADSLEESDAGRIVTIRKRPWHRWFPLAPILRIATVVKMEAPDILHLQGSTLTYPLIYSLLFAPRQLKKVITIHGHPVEEGLLGGWYKKNTFRYVVSRWAERRIPYHFDAIVAVTSALRNDLADRYPSYAGVDIRVVPNGVDPEEFSPGIPDPGHFVAGVSVNRGALTVLNAKALMPFNGQEFLIRAFDEIAKEISDCRLLLVGSGPDMDRLRELSIDLGLADRIHFLGRIPNEQMPSLLRMVDIVVIPSVDVGGVKEGSSLAVLEAMAVAKPVVASNVGGLSEIILDGKTGLLVPPRDAGAIARAIMSLYRDKQIASELGRNSRESILRERTWQQIAARYFYIYRSLWDSGKHHE